MCRVARELEQVAWWGLWGEMWAHRLRGLISCLGLCTPFRTPVYNVPGVHGNGDTILVREG